MWILTHVVTEPWAPPPQGMLISCSDEAGASTGTPSAAGNGKSELRFQLILPICIKISVKNGIAPSYFQLETIRGLPWSACLANQNTPPLFRVILRITCLANNFWNQRQCLPSEPRAFCSQTGRESWHLFWGSREGRQVQAPQERLGYPELKVLLLEENPLPLQLCPGWGSQDTRYK